MARSLLSIIIPSPNSARFFGGCFALYGPENYSRVKHIVAVCDSVDATKHIGAKFTDWAFNHAPERSAQHIFGASKVRGEYVAIVDSGMKLAAKPIEYSVGKMFKDPTLKSVIIPEEPIGEGFWAHCKALIRVITSAMTLWKLFPSSPAIPSVGVHLPGFQNLSINNGGHIRIMKTLKKKYNYPKSTHAILQKRESSSDTCNTGTLERYQLFLGNPRKLFTARLLGRGYDFLKLWNTFGLGIAVASIAVSNEN